MVLLCVEAHFITRSSVSSSKAKISGTIFVLLTIAASPSLAHHHLIGRWLTIICVCDMKNDETVKSLLTLTAASADSRRDECALVQDSRCRSECPCLNIFVPPEPHMCRQFRWGVPRTSRCIQTMSAYSARHNLTYVQHFMLVQTILT